MALNIIYDTQEEIPEQHRELFSERDGKWELTGITGMKTQADIDRLQTALTKERGETKRFKEKAAPWGDLVFDDVHKDLDELAEARVRLEAGEGKIDEGKMEQLVTARVATQVAPLQRELDTLKTSNSEQAELIVGFQSDNTRRTIGDAVRKAAVGIKVIDTAVEDVLLLGERIFEITDEGTVLSRDGVGCTPGIAPDIWLSEMQEKRPHWWPTSTGGGAGGSGGGSGFPNNPFSSEHWNMTEQGRAVVTDRPKAERMAQAAGTKIGGPRPAQKIQPRT